MEQNRSVLQFVCFRSPYGGSFFKSLLRLERTLENDSIDMVYLFHEDTSDIDWVRNLINEGKTIYFLSGNFFSDIFTIKNILLKHHVKYVHTHFSGTKFFFLFNIVKQLWSKDLLIIRHLRNHDQPRGFIGENLKKVLSHIDLYIGCSESVAIEYRKNFGLKNGKVTFVTNAIDFGRLNKYDELKREDFQISPQSTVFLMFGFDYYRKGVDVVLEAMYKLVEQGYGVSLLLSLSVNTEFIESKIVERFGEIPQWLKILKPRDDIASYYKLCDYFISASREEGFCNALVEAAYCERPIITSDIPGPNSLNIPHTRKFPSENVIELKKEMLFLMSLSDEHKRRIVDDQKAYVIKSFDLNSWARQIFSIYKNLGKDHNGVAHHAEVGAKEYHVFK